MNFSGPTAKRQGADQWRSRATGRRQRVYSQPTVANGYLALLYPPHPFETPVRAWSRATGRLQRIYSQTTRRRTVAEQGDRPASARLQPTDKAQACGGEGRQAGFSEPTAKRQDVVWLAFRLAVDPLKPACRPTPPLVGALSFGCRPAEAGLSPYSTAGRPLVGWL